ncbi:MAG: hypothetical protein Ct9H90mP22_7970 [Gammaproteobacteria bacterium]|nr:MAG: hypothetical protein Ct9H90mP22_7970 [Gammaproteobacteria bacterium]
MKNKLLVIIFFFFSLKNHNALSQNSPKVPNSIRIDNILLNIKPEAKEIFQIEVDALHANQKYFQIFMIELISIFQLLKIF